MTAPPPLAPPSPAAPAPRAPGPPSDRLWLAIGAFLVVGALLSGIGALWIKIVPTTYQADATVILLVEQGNGDNPYTYFPKSVIMTAQAVAEHTRQESVRAAMVEQGGLTDFLVDVQNDGNQWVPIYNRPNITVSAQSTDAELAQLTVELVVRQVVNRLKEIQGAAGVDGDVFIDSQVLRSPDVSAVPGRPSRAVAVVMVLAFWAACLAFLGVRRSVNEGRRAGDRLILPLPRGTEPRGTEPRGSEPPPRA